jgi:hypothetical protein
VIQRGGRIPEVPGDNEERFLGHADEYLWAQDVPREREHEYNDLHEGQPRTISECKEI